MKTRLAAITALALMMLVPVTQATPITGIIDTSGSYSVIHNGSNPGGEGDPDEWGWFLPNQQIDLELDNGILTLIDPQTFLLAVVATRSIVEVTLNEMMLDLNDDDGFLNGFLNYTMGSTDGVFVFDNLNHNNIFNSSNRNSNILSVYVWGGDPGPLNNMGIDLGLSLVVPEPASVALLLLGLAGMTFLIRRREQPIRATRVS